MSFGLNKFSGLYLWAAFIIMFGIWTPHLFLSFATLHSIAAQQSIVAIMALAVVVPLSAGVYDLSIGATANIGGIAATILNTQHHVGTIPAMCMGVLLCIVIGLINGVLVVRFHINSFIATLGMSSVIAAVQTMLSAQDPVGSTDKLWGQITQTKFFGFQIVTLYLIVVAVLLWWLLTVTPAGRCIYAVGGNPDAARLSGVNVDNWTYVSLIISGGIAGLAGVLYTSLLGPSLRFGPSMLLPAFAAVFLGSTQLKPGRFNVWGTLIAVYALATGIKGFQFVTSVQWLSDLFNGLALILAVGLAVTRQRGRTRRTRSGRTTAGARQEPVAPFPEEPVIIAEGLVGTVDAERR